MSARHCQCAPRLKRGAPTSGAVASGGQNLPISWCIVTMLPNSPPSTPRGRRVSWGRRSSDENQIYVIFKSGPGGRLVQQASTSFVNTQATSRSAAQENWLAFLGQPGVRSSRRRQALTRANSHLHGILAGSWGGSPKAAHEI